MARLDCHNRHPLHEVRETRRAPPAIEHTPCALGIAPFNITLQSHTSASSLSFVRRRRSKPRTRRAFRHRSKPHSRQALRHRSTPRTSQLHPSASCVGGARRHAPGKRFATARLLGSESHPPSFDGAHPASCFGVAGRSLSHTKATRCPLRHAGTAWHPF